MRVLLAENAERKSADQGLTDSRTVKNPFHVKLGRANQGVGTQGLTECFT
jgi:hypothetical protein